MFGEQCVTATIPRNFQTSKPRDDRTGARLCDDGARAADSRRGLRFAGAATSSTLLPRGAWRACAQRDALRRRPAASECAGWIALLSRFAAEPADRVASCRTLDRGVPREIASRGDRDRARPHWVPSVRPLPLQFCHASVGRAANARVGCRRCGAADRLRRLHRSRPRSVGWGTTAECAALRGDRRSRAQLAAAPLAARSALVSRRGEKASQLLAVRSALGDRERDGRAAAERAVLRRAPRGLRLRQPRPLQRAPVEVAAPPVPRDSGTRDVRRAAVAAADGGQRDGGEAADGEPRQGPAHPQRARRLRSRHALARHQQRALAPGPLRGAGAARADATLVRRAAALRLGGP